MYSLLLSYDEPTVFIESIHDPTLHHGVKTYGEDSHTDSRARWLASAFLPRLVDPAKRVRSVGSRGALKAVVGHDGMMVGLAQLKNQYLEAAFLRGSSKAVPHWEQKEKWSSTLLNIFTYHCLH